jgi:hypothetical protein
VYYSSVGLFFLREKLKQTSLPFEYLSFASNQQLGHPRRRFWVVGVAAAVVVFIIESWRRSLWARSPFEFTSPSSGTCDVLLSVVIH